MAKKSLTSRTVELLRSRGYIAENVEKYNAFSGHKNDLFGCIDVLAIGNGETLAVQVTSYPNIGERTKKIHKAEAFEEMRNSGWQVWVHGWLKVKGKYEVMEAELM